LSIDTEFLLHFRFTDVILQLPLKRLNLAYNNRSVFGDHNSCFSSEPTFTARLRNGLSDRLKAGDGWMSDYPSASRSKDIFLLQALANVVNGVISKHI
jgi:hypothetical protein